MKVLFQEKLDKIKKELITDDELNLVQIRARQLTVRIVEYTFSHWEGIIKEAIEEREDGRK